jgi:carboxyl-terminal processing protease
MIKRETILLPSVTWNLLPDAPQIGFVQIGRISETTSDEIQQGIGVLIQDGAQSFVLDLRNNGGGLVEEGVNIAELFLSSGEIIYRQFKDQEVEVFTVQEPGIYADYPMVVLVNENTASAAEIIAGAISNNPSITLIGKSTYGKTTIQYVFSLSDSSSIHVTSGKWWIPGVEFPLKPDILLPDETAEGDVLRLIIKTLTAP